MAHSEDHLYVRPLFSGVRRAGLWVGLVVGLMVALTAGCARRALLTATELERIRAEDPAVARLRVHAGRRLVLEYAAAAAETYSVAATGIREASERRREVRIIGARTPGAIVGESWSGDRPVLWVSFDDRCRDAGCALGFVLDESGVFRWFAAPEVVGVTPRAYDRRRRRGTALTLMRMRSLADANAVYARMRGRRLVTIDLVVRKRVRRRDEAAVERAPGFRGG